MTKGSYEWEFNLAKPARPEGFEMDEAHYPDTVIVVHPKERRSKCTILPLRGTAGMKFARSTSPRATGPVDGYLRLNVNGPPLTEQDADRGLLLLDGTWRWVEDLAVPFGTLETRSITGIKTAYPRGAAIGELPDGGLATVEALYAAQRILGRQVAGLLDHYHWANEFLALNGWTSVPEKVSR